MSKMTKTIATLGVVAGLGVAMLPMGAYAANSGNPVKDGPNASADGTARPTASVDVEFQAEVKETIEISAADDLVDAGTVDSSAINDKGTTKVTIHTNAAGYTATIAASTGAAEDGTGGNANMVGTTAANTIPGATLNAGTSAWGYKIGSITDFAAASTTAEKFADTSAKSADAGDSYDLNFAVSVAPNQAADTYTGQVTLTATAK